MLQLTTFTSLLPVGPHVRFISATHWPILFWSVLFVTAIGGVLLWYALVNRSRRKNAPRPRQRAVLQGRANSRTL